MPFSVRKQLSPQQMTANWTKYTSQAGDKLLNGYSNPRRDPQANAAQSAASYQTGTAAAVSLYEKNLAGYDSNQAISNMKAFGVSRYTQAATQKANNYLKAATGLAPAIMNIVDSLPQDRSTPAARDARMTAMVQGLRGLRGKYRKNSTSA